MLNSTEILNIKQLLSGRRLFFNVTARIKHKTYGAGITKYQFLKIDVSHWFMSEFSINLTYQQLRTNRVMSD